MSRRTITPEAVQAMRDWLKDAVNCVPAAVDELSDYQVIRAVELRYFGGLLAFVDTLEVQS